MLLQTFVDKGGFKLLAVARLSSGAYALVCYLCNCLAAGVEEVVSSVGELSVLLGIPERQARQAVEELESCNIVFVTRPQGGKTLAARLNLDPNSWQNLRKETSSKRKRTPLGDARNVHPIVPPAPPTSGGAGLRDVSHVEGAPEGGSKAKESRGNDARVSDGKAAVALGGPGGDGLSPRQALVFPAGQGPGGEGRPGREELLESTAVRRVLEAFAAKKGGGIDEEKERSYAALLAENHPAEQILDLIEAFGREIPSLGLLAGAWMHYSERFHHLEKEELSLAAYRKKAEAMERKLRQLAATELKRAQHLKVTLLPDEELLLRIFMRHESPRKQLYWALQARDRYPHLQDFFHATAPMALRPRN